MTSTQVVINQSPRRWLGPCCGLVLALAAPPALTTSATAAVGLAEVDGVLESIRAEVELLRFHMGKPPNEQGPPAVDDVQPHEVYLQAQNLFRKLNRLSRELIDAPRESAPVAPPPTEIVIADVYVPVAASLEQVRALKAGLGITADATSPRRRAAADLTGVYRATVQTNRQLNLISDARFTAREVFGQISLAITYAGGILAAFPDVEAIPEPPPFVPGKSPADVYRQLSACLRTNRRIAQAIEFPLLRYDPRDFRRTQPLPSDVYDMATLLVSYVGHIAAELDAPEIYPELNEPTHVFPSHAYQHATRLLAQLNQIEELVEGGMAASVR